MHSRYKPGGTARDLRDRWTRGECYRLVEKASAGGFAYTLTMLQRLAELAPRTSAGLADLRGFPLAPLGLDGRAQYSKGSLSDVDLSYSVSDVGVGFNKVEFHNCNFTKSKLYDYWPIDCRFSRCDFIDIRFMSSFLGRRVVYESCNFSYMSTGGEGFDFGLNTVYINCKFQEIDIRAALDVHNLTFRSCQMSGNIQEAWFQGKAWARRSNRCAVYSFILRSDQPVRFINCDLSGLVVPILRWDPDIPCVNTNPPPFHPASPGVKSFFGII